MEIIRHAISSSTLERSSPFARYGNKWRQLSEGSFGETCVSFDPKRQQCVVIKLFKSKFNPDCAEQQQLLLEFTGEFKYLQELYQDSQQCFVEPVRVGLGYDDRLWFSCGYAKLGTLDSVAGVVRLVPAAVLSVARKIFTGIALIHGKGLLHRDIKGLNIFIDLDDEGDASVKIGDFGLVRTKPTVNDDITVCGTKRFESPEVLQGQLYGESNDLWAAAVTILDVLNQRLPDAKFEEARTSGYKTYRTIMVDYVKNLRDQLDGASLLLLLAPLYDLLVSIFAGIPEEIPEKKSARKGASAVPVSRPPTASVILAHPAFSAADDELLSLLLTQEYQRRVRTDMAVLCTEAGAPELAAKFTAAPIEMSVPDASLLTVERLVAMGVHWGPAARLASTARRFLEPNPESTKGGCSCDCQHLRSRVEALEILMGVDQAQQELVPVTPAVGRMPPKTPTTGRRVQFAPQTPLTAPLSIPPPIVPLSVPQPPNVPHVRTQAAADSVDSAAPYESELRPDAVDASVAGPEGTITTKEQLRACLSAEAQWLLLERITPELSSPVLSLAAVQKMLAAAAKKTAGTQQAYKRHAVRLIALYHLDRPVFDVILSAGASITGASVQRDVSEAVKRL